MVFHADERIALFIDGPNLYAAARVLELDIDYRRLLAHFSSQCRLLRANYYTMLHPEQESPLRSLVDWLDYNGYAVVAKRPREHPGTGKRRGKNDMEIELIVDALETAPHLDHIVLFSGNGDFCRPVASLQRSGKLVSVVSTLLSEPPMVSDDLRRQADRFIELDDLRRWIRREREDTHTEYDEGE